MSNAQISARVLTPTAVKTGAYSAAPADLVVCDTTSAGFTVTLPAAPPDLTPIGVKMVKQGSANAVTIAASGRDVFNIAGGSSTLTLSLLYQGVMLQYQASSNLWYVLSDDLALSQLDARYPSNPLTTLGDLAYGGASGTLTRLAGDTSNTRKFLREVSSGGVAAAPAWDTITAGDVPTLNQNTTGTAAGLSSTLAVGSGGTGQVTQQAALDALAGAVTNNQVLAGNGTHVTLRALAAADLPAATTGAQGAVQLDSTATDIKALGTQSAGSSTKAPAADHVHPTTGLLTKVADNTASGTALINGTATFCSWTAPNDGALHPVIYVCTQVITSTATGGAIGVTFTDPAGNVRSNLQLLAGGQASGVHLVGFTTLLVQSNTTISAVQASALTGGAGTVYVQLWAM